MKSLRTPLKHLGLWPKTALAISLGFAALLGAFALLGERALHDSTERILNERLVIAQMTANQIDGVIQEAVAELQRAYAYSNYLAFDQPQTENRRSEIVTSGKDDLLPESPERAILLSPPRFYPLGADWAEVPQLKPLFGLPQVSLSGPFYDPDSRRPVAAVFLPVYERGHLVGTLVGLLDLNSVAIRAPLQQAATLGISGHSSLVDQNGLSLVSTYQLDFLSPGEHLTFYRRAMALGKPLVETVPFEIEVPDEKIGELHVMAFVPLRHAPWGVAIGGDVAETFAGVTRLRWGLIILGILAFASIWAATMVGMRQVLAPLRDLTLAAQRIAAGELHVPLQRASSGEIGALATALEHMRLELLSNIAELAEWNETLETRVRAQTESLRQQQALTQQLLRQVITAQEEERARLSRELHDEIGQTLTAVELSLNRLMRSLPPEASEPRERLERASALTQQALVDLRRVIAAMRPGVLDELGLLPALGWISEHTLGPLDLHVSIESSGLPERLPGEIETVLFRIAQEAMSNVARHSQARNLDIRLKRIDGKVLMVLADDGCGWDLSEAVESADRGRHLGLASMKERASLIGGEVQIDSAPGQGTTVRVIVPLGVDDDTAQVTLQTNPPAGGR